MVDVIELARGDAQPPEAGSLRLDEVAAETLERIRRHHPEVRFRAELEPVELTGDAPRLSRAIGNLLENAAKHAEEVELLVTAAGVTVRDHGPGLTEEELPHLFDRFYRGSTARGLPGTGLGLAIVRQVAETHGGSIEAENAEGAGARFVLSLPGNALGGRSPGAE